MLNGLAARRSSVQVRYPPLEIKARCFFVNFCFSKTYEKTPGLFFFALPPGFLGRTRKYRQVRANPDAENRERGSERVSDSEAITGKMLSARFSPGPPGEKARLAAFCPTLPCVASFRRSCPFLRSRSASKGRYFHCFGVCPVSFLPGIR